MIKLVCLIKNAEIMCKNKGRNIFKGKYKKFWIKSSCWESVFNFHCKYYLEEKKKERWI